MARRAARNQRAPGRRHCGCGAGAAWPPSRRRLPGAARRRRRSGRSRDTRGPDPAKLPVIALAPPPWSPHAGRPAGEPDPRTASRGRLLRAIPVRMAAAPMAWGAPTGSPNTSAPAAAPTSGSRFTKAPASSAGTRAWPWANRVLAPSVPRRARPAVAASAAAGPPGPPPARGGGGPSVKTATGRAARAAARNCGRDGRGVAALEQPGLGHGERGRESERGQDQDVAGQGGPAAPGGGDQDDPGERHREPGPGRRRPQPALPGGGHEGHEHGRGPDEQGGMADAGAGDPGVLDQDRPAVADRPPGRHGRAPGTTDPAPEHGQEHGRGQAEPGHREPARRQPGQGELGHGHGRAPQQPGGGERAQGGTAVGGVHGAMVAAPARRIRLSRRITK